MVEASSKRNQEQIKVLQQEIKAFDTVRMALALVSPRRIVRRKGVLYRSRVTRLLADLQHIWLAAVTSSGPPNPEIMTLCYIEIINLSSNRYKNGLQVTHRSIGIDFQYINICVLVDSQLIRIFCLGWGRLGSLSLMNRSY